MMTHAKRLIEFFTAKIKRPRLLERVIEANLDTQPGDLIRAWRRPLKAPNRYSYYVGKREFIRRYGRDAWYAIPRDRIWRDGKRQYVAYTVYLEYGAGSAAARRIEQGKRP